MGRRKVHHHLVGCYVYVLTVDGEHRYVGKGKRYRVVDHLGRIRAIASGHPEYVSQPLPAYRHLAAAWAAGAVIDYQVLVNNLTDDEAWAAERLLIASYPDDQLWNIHGGGKGDTGGRRLRAIWNDPVQRAKLAAKIKAGHLDDKYRDRARIKALAQWADPKHREARLRQHRGLWDDPDAAAERKAALKLAWSTKVESKRKVREAVTKAWTPERRAAMAENRRAAWADPEFSKRVRAKIAAARAKPGCSEKMRNKAVERWADPIFRTKTIRAIRESKSKKNDRAQECLHLCAAGTETV